MSRWGVVRLVTGREVRERLRSKPLLASTALTLVLLVVVVLVASAVGGGDDRPSFDVGAVGAQSARVVAVAGDLAGDEAEVELTEVADTEEARALVEADGDDRLDAVVLDDRIVVADADELDPGLAAILQAANREVALATVLDEAGTSPEQRAEATPAPLELDAVGGDDRTDERVGFATVGTILLYTQLIGFGYWVSSGIVEEKASRVIEILLAKAGPRPLLAGKVLGVGLVGLLQLVVFLVVGLGVAAATDVVTPPPGTTGVAVALVAWFLAGYALYAALFAMAGAIASRSEELQGTTAPITVLVMAAFFASIASTNDPDGPVAVVAGYVPFTAPLAMPIRMAAGAVGPVEVAVALLGVAATGVVVMLLAARAYAGGALATRRRISLREALARAEG
jgi:ABC-2 type transport system permease protein